VAGGSMLYLERVSKKNPQETKCTVGVNNVSFEIMEGEIL
jgi:ABC-type proline/glycine betaine transport system ATPase subunit